MRRSHLLLIGLVVSASCTGAEELAQVVRELAPKADIKVAGTSAADKSRSIPMDISVSKAELGYAPKFPLKEALRDYMDELWADGARP